MALWYVMTGGADLVAGAPKARRDAETHVGLGGQAWMLGGQAWMLGGGACSAVRLAEVHAVVHAVVHAACSAELPVFA